MITGSIVAYKNTSSQLKKSIQSFLNSEIDCEIKLYVINNAPNYCYDELVRDRRIEYITNTNNIGFGAAHNIALRMIHSISQYHLILNPDICFEPNVLNIIYSCMENDKSIGMLIPKVKFMNGTMNYVCRLLPSPGDVFLRRFCPMKSILDKVNYRYELKLSGYDRKMHIPNISGCFMFLRTSNLDKIGYFDERFFLYFEDVDLSRRMSLYSNNIYWPEVIIYHEGAQLSHKNNIAFIYHTISAIKYFNKYGWIFDKERRRINKETLNQFMVSGK